MNVWHVQGIIGNGGFNYFFESHIPIVETIESFRALGATEAVDTVHAALAVFLGEPPVDSDDGETRLQKLRQLSERFNDGIFEALRNVDHKFWGLRDAIDSKLLEYVEKHKDEIGALSSEQ